MAPLTYGFNEARIGIPVWLLSEVAGTGDLVRVRVREGRRACCGRGYTHFEDLVLTGAVLTVSDGECLLVCQGIGGPTLWANFRLDDVLELGRA